MKYELVPAVEAVAEIIPPKKDGAFEKAMEVAHLILDHEPISILSHTVDNAIQTIGMVRETKYRVEAFKYATHLEEVRINASVEMVRLQQNHAINLYIDQSFQKAIDRVENEYFEASTALNNYGKKIIQEIDHRVERTYKDIDKQYMYAIKENEMKCALYRDYLNTTLKQGVKQYDVMKFITQKTFTNKRNYSEKEFIAVCELLNEMVRQQGQLISFEKFMYDTKNVKKIL